MKGELYIDGKKYISTSRAARLTGYANDYVGQLARGGKLDARMVGRSWFVAEDSLLGYKDEPHADVATESRKRRVKVPRRYVRRAASGSVDGQHAIGAPARRRVTLRREVIRVSGSRQAAGRGCSRQRTSASGIERALAVMQQRTPSELVSRPVALIAEPVKSAVLPVVAKSPYYARPELLKVAGNIFLASTVALAFFAVVLSAGDMYRTTERGFVVLGDSTERAASDALSLVGKSPVYLDAGLAAVGTVVQGGPDARDPFFSRLSGIVARRINSVALAFYENVNSLFGTTVPKIDVRVGRLATQAGGTTETRGMVVAPSTGDPSKDAQMAKYIQKSFSDEVEVVSKDGDTGVIRPVFKDGKGDEYIYVLVPIAEGG